MKLIFENDKYIAQSDFAEKNIPKKAGFRWNPDLKHWWTDDARKAQQLAQFADDVVRALISLKLEQKQVVIEASSKVSTTAHFPVPQGLEYLPYQKAGIAYGVERANVLIGDEMGLGKTIQAIGIFNAQPEIKTVLIVCPASLKLNWKREFTKWASRPVEVAVVKEYFPMSVDVVILNYDALKKYHVSIRTRTWDLLIVDEAHYMKNSKAQRTKEILGYISAKSEECVAPIAAKKKAFLTGTPIPNRPVESWTLLHTLAPDVFKSWKYFVTRYCAGVQTKYGWDVSGASNLDELQMKLRENIMVRRLKVDVLKELPAKRRQIIEIAANGATKIVAQEQATFEKLQDRLIDLKVNLELAKTGSQAEYEYAVQALQGGASAVFAEMAKLRHEIALAKVPYVVEFLQECFETSDEKIVVFAHHLDVIEQIAAAFPGRVSVVTGQVTIEKRQQAVDSFQTDPNIKLFVGNIQAAGVGFTLTAASHVVFAELDWVPGNISQAEDRCHRIGQTESVLVQHLVFEDSLDVDMANTLIAKQAVIDQSLDGFELDVALPEKVKETVVAIKMTNKEFEVPAMSVEQSQAVHQGLRWLASVCDGATAIDGMGFNKIDTGIGKRLASLPSLSNKQALLGKKLVLKYRRQIGEELIVAIKGE